MVAAGVYEVGNLKVKGNREPSVNTRKTGVRCTGKRGPQPKRARDADQSAVVSWAIFCNER
jgi:flagellar basal body L-ring protein FlgH